MTVYEKNQQMMKEHSAREARKRAFRNQWKKAIDDGLQFSEAAKNHRFSLEEKEMFAELTAESQRDRKLVENVMAGFQKGGRSW